MHILFCDNPFNNKTVDPDYADEFAEAQSNGFTTQLFSFETLTKDADALQALRKVKTVDNFQQIIYRGWMLKPKQYELLYRTLLTKNYQLVNSPLEYQNCHYLPDSYRFIHGQTPRTIWLEVDTGHIDYEIILEKIKVFGNAPLIVKDFVKSQKHYWDTACFIPSAMDKNKVRSVVEKFLSLQDADLNKGLVFREYIELNHLTNHSKSGMPLKQEYRLFFLNGQLLGCYNYWEEGEYSSDEMPPLNLFIEIAATVESNFFSMDVAKASSGKWIIIELGDGQVAGLPDKVDKNEFYRQLWKLSNG